MPWRLKLQKFYGKDPLKNCGMRYVSILSDGDAKTYQHLSSLNVYGGYNFGCFNSLAIEHNELSSVSVGHFADKRDKLMRLAQSEKKKNSSD
ncbi:hypothetical protein TNCV_1074561 [Trichonephila clavipes]|uniref:Uncharacterized protein n=1 Tax=Trichonephila clavipes TaxID=2585209 RepID=A0A8X6T0K7_TRICX|nr:hypothetical protein TNCV_1074561 [Trichonephila clavipes]